MLQNRRQFTTEFKIEAVRLIEGSGRTSVDVARSLGVDGGLLRRWRQIYGRDGNVIDS
jgi:transposase